MRASALKAFHTQSVLAKSESSQFWRVWKLRIMYIYSHLFIPLFEFKFGTITENRAAHRTSSLSSSSSDAPCESGTPVRAHSHAFEWSSMDVLVCLLCERSVRVLNICVFWVCVCPFVFDLRRNVKYPLQVHKHSHSALPKLVLWYNVCTFQT